MKICKLIICGLLLTFTCFSQEKKETFKGGEWLRYKMSYSGFFRAGTAVLELKETNLNGEKVFYSKGTGWTSGLLKWFFKVDDVYESYFDKDQLNLFFLKEKLMREGIKNIE